MDFSLRAAQIIDPNHGEFIIFADMLVSGLGSLAGFEQQGATHMISGVVGTAIASTRAEVGGCNERYGDRIGFYAAFGSALSDIRPGE